MGLLGKSQEMNCAQKWNAEILKRSGTTLYRLESDFFYPPKYKENKQFLNLNYDTGPIHLRWNNTEMTDQLV